MCVVLVCLRQANHFESFRSNISLYYYRCFDVHMALDNEAEAVTYIDKLLEANKLTISEQRADKMLHSAMRRCRYYSATKEQSPNWSMVGHDVCIYYMNVL